MSEKVFKWYSFHPLTNGQKEIIKDLGFSTIDHKKKIIWSKDPVIQLIKLEGDSLERTIGIVAPASVVLQFLRDGFKVVEFRNLPSERRKGIFVCEGAYIHTLMDSNWVDCPIPIEKQERGDLSEAWTKK